MIEDADAIGRPSVELVEFLRREFPAGGPARLGVIVTARHPDALEDLAPGPPILLPVLTRERVERVLSRDLRLAPRVTRDILDALGDPALIRDGLHLVFSAVKDCAVGGRLAWDPAGWFTWGAGYGGRDAVRVPRDLTDALLAPGESQPWREDLVACAACLGSSFEGEVVAEALGRSTVETLHHLDELAEQTGLVALGDDGRYTFRPPLIVDALRARLGITGAGPLGGVVRPVVRQYHARIASALEPRVVREPDLLLDLARHTFAAGARHAGVALERCISATRLSSRRFDHPSALRFLEMARECARVSGKEVDLEGEEVVVRCHAAFVSGESLVEAAEAGLRTIDRRNPPSGRLIAAVARACDAAASQLGPGQRDRFLQETLRLGRLLTSVDRPALEQAEGHHFVARAARADRATRESQLRRGLALLEDAADAAELKAQLLNSLAECLSRAGEEKDNLEARLLFAASLALKESLGDRPGSARSHGGLGRSYLAPPRDVARARQHLQEDLRISEEIGDRAGQSQMHSLLGACDLEEGLWEQAAEHYRRALELAPDSRARAFAGAGRLRALAGVGRTSELDECGAGLVEALRDADVPQDAREALASAVQSCDSAPGRRWALELLDLCPPGTRHRP